MNIVETILQIIIFPFAFAAVVFVAGMLTLVVAMAAVIAYEAIRERMNNK